MNTFLQKVLLVFVYAAAVITFTILGLSYERSGTEYTHLNETVGNNSLLEFNSAISKNNSPMSEVDYLKETTAHIKNMPPAEYILGTNKNGPKFLGNKSCAAFPYVFTLKFSNTIWQVQKQSNWTFYLFGAYWDVRLENLLSVRILGMMDRVDENITTNYCQIWFENQTQPIISPITGYDYLWVKGWGNYKDGELQPYLFNCEMPKYYSGQIPTSVSVVSTSPCSQATNNLRVHFDKPGKKETFAVCVKGMDFIDPDWSVRLVEWIELLGILGVHKIFLYDLAVHPNMNKVYKYYQDLDKVEVLPLTFAGDLPNEPHLRHSFMKRKMTNKRQNELIPYNDCLYRNMYKYDYISLLDIDEIIIPHNNASTWPELAKILEQGSTDSHFFIFANFIFSISDDNYAKKDAEHIPDYLHMLRHTARSSKDAGKGSGIKCFHRPENILTLHNHFPTNCLKPCRRNYVDHKEGFLHHYKRGGPVEPKGNETFAIDETVWKWKEELILRSNKALQELGLISA